ncbi:MAG: AAA family ATPase, partial [Beijerinckiaceae bacterium]
MKFDKLRITGFKTFVDPTEFLIQPGLTGVVGPNGCGKSNLVEAMRWVMGETSFKSMRASAMDDVIFNGSGRRPPRQMAEVALTIDNESRTAPVAFNDVEKLDISRRIEREEGSTYRINGREARARDVQLLFADAATGARSPAMVRQGQIGEIIAAKPQARRRILEDAAGIGGLYSRRHEAELRLKGAEENLLRVEDVLRHIDQQVDGLSRQAKQAVRYREIAAQIRKTEALLFHLAVLDARAQVLESQRQFDADTRAVAERTRLQGEAARVFAVAEHAIQPLREEEARRAAALQRLQIAREQIDAEERQAKQRVEELTRRLAELDRDRDRARQTVEDAERSIAAL